MDNRLTTLPQEISGLTALRYLDSSFNRLMNLPPGISGLTALRFLGIHSNQLTTLPPEIGRLTALTVFYLDHNQLSTLPPEIGRLTALTELPLHNNHLTSLPPEMVQLTALERLFLHDNPDLDVPLGPTRFQCEHNNAKPKPPREILDYYFRMHPAPAAPIAHGSAGGAVPIFVSYSHQDKKWLDKLKTTIAPLLRGGALDLWDDTRIKAGDHWKEEIEKALSRAKVGVLLVSRHFLASDFIVRNELPPLLDAAERKGVKIFWIPVAACMYEETPVKAYQAAWNPARPLAKLGRGLDEALVHIGRQLKDACGMP